MSECPVSQKGEKTLNTSNIRVISPNIETLIILLQHESFAIRVSENSKNVATSITNEHTKTPSHPILLLLPTTVFLKVEHAIFDVAMDTQVEVGIIVEMRGRVRWSGVGSRRIRVPNVASSAIGCQICVVDGRADADLCGASLESGAQVVRLDRSVSKDSRAEVGDKWTYHHSNVSRSDAFLEVVFQNDVVSWSCCTDDGLVAHQVEVVLVGVCDVRVHESSRQRIAVVVQDVCRELILGVLEKAAMVALDRTDQDDRWISSLVMCVETGDACA